MFYKASYQAAKVQIVFSLDASAFYDSFSLVLKIEQCANKPDFSPRNIQKLIIYMKTAKLWIRKCEYSHLF